MSANKLITCDVCNKEIQSGWRGYLEGLRSKMGLTEIYQFGVYTCDSIWALLHLVDCTTLWGFDSFQGLPQELNEPVYQDGWNKEGFDARKHFKVNSTEECIKRTAEHIVSFNHFPTNINLIPGFYEEVLTDDLVREAKMQPALYVDIDCDLYSSTKTVLNWMLRNKLLVKGSVIGFDDWGGTRNFDLCLDGESRAFREIVQEFDLDVELLFNDNGLYPHAQRIYLLRGFK